MLGAGLMLAAFAAPLPAQQSHRANPQRFDSAQRSEAAQRFDDASAAETSPRTLRTNPFPDERPTSPGTTLPPKPAGSGSGRGAAPPSPWATLGGLAIVIVMIVVTARVWKRHGPRGHAPLPPEALELLGRKAIDQRQAIHLVRLGGRILVLGSSPAGLNTLAEFTDPVEVDLLAGLCRRQSDDLGVAQSFRALFTRRAGAATPATGTVAGGGASLTTDQHELVQRLRSAAASSREGSRERIHG